MDKAVELVHDKLKEDCKILIYVDGDCDGAMASSALTQILKYIKPDVKLDYTYAFQKDHGLTMSKLANFTKDEFGLIIIPDASMEAKDAIEITRNFSAPILVLDHHLVSSETQDTWTGEWMDREKAISIYKENPSEYKTRFHTDCYVNYCLPVNSTDGQYPCTAICGTGVVMKFAEAYCEKYNVDTEILDNIMELVSLAEIADGMDSMKLEARWYMLEGLKEFYWHNDFIKELCDRLADEMPYGRTISSMGWTIAPKINGVFRYGTEEEIVNMCRAIRGEQETIIYKPRRKSKNAPVPEPEEHTLQWDMARTCCNVKSRQDTAVRSFMEKVEEIIKKTEANKRSILFVDCTSVIDKKTVSGLVARKLATKYYRPVVLMRDFTSTEYGGSMRNYSQGNVDDLKSLLEKAGVVCKRHSNAAGIHIEKSKLSEIQAKCDELLPIDSLVTIHQVDWQVDLADLKKEAEAAVERYGKTLHDKTFTALGQPDYYWQSIFRFWSNSRPEYGKLVLQYGLVLLILLLVPAVSLSGMTDSRMERRLAEMGVWRAFGAPVTTLMMQIISENFLFTVLGGVFGLLLSYLLLYLSRSWIMQLDAIFVDVLPEGADVVFSPSMLVNYQVFGITLFVCFLLNLLSALIPAWRASHRQIIYSLNAK